MTCSMAMCGFINMSIVKTGAVLVSQREEAHFLQRCRAFATGRARRALRSACSACLVKPLPPISQPCSGGLRCACHTQIGYLRMPEGLC